MLARAGFELIVAAAVGAGVPLVVDEAYMEFATEGTASAVDLAERDLAVVALRTFSKAYGWRACKLATPSGVGRRSPRFRPPSASSPFGLTASGRSVPLRPWPTTAASNACGGRPPRSASGLPKPCGRRDSGA